VNEGGTDNLRADDNTASRRNSIADSEPTGRPATDGRGAAGRSTETDRDGAGTSVDREPSAERRSDGRDPGEDNGTSPTGDRGGRRSGGAR
jgi:hypothetical protein